MPLIFAHDSQEFAQRAQASRDAGDGGHVVFLGTVRNFNKSKPVSFLLYEAYEALAIKQFAEIEKVAKERFAISSVHATHRVGKTGVGEHAVAISASAPHRHEAFLAARFLIDELKKTVAIWKQEHYEDGSSTWDTGLCQCSDERMSSEVALEPVKRAFGSGQDFAKLRKARVLLVGAGGLGCPIALNLAALGLGHLSIFDGDIIAEANLARQFAYTRENIGHKKAVAIKKFLSDRFSWLDLSAHDEFLSQERASHIAKNYDLIIDSSDCLKTKIMLAKTSYEYKINFICASVHSDEGEVSVVSATAQGGCFCCWRKKISQPNTCATNGVFTHICSVVAAYACAQAKEILADSTVLEHNFLTLINFQSGFHKLALAPDPSCRVCEPGAGVNKLNIIKASNTSYA